MVDGARDYPLLRQLLGAQTWRVHPERSTISVEDARLGVDRARRRLATLVHEPALHAASDIDPAFLRAMARDDGSTMAAIAQRLGVDTRYASQHRLRLIAVELIHPTRRGYVDFALPLLREYLREHDGAEA